ncbi:MAG: hypothetical protein ABI688_04140 [Bacteroidota bacterium]
MGLSIHYWGKIKDYTLIDALTAEAADICKSLHWGYQLFTTSKSDLKPGEKQQNIHQMM